MWHWGFICPCENKSLHTQLNHHKWTVAFLPRSHIQTDHHPRFPISPQWVKHCTSFWEQKSTGQSWQQYAAFLISTSSVRVRRSTYTQYLAGEGRWHHFSTMKWLIVPHLAVNFKHRQEQNRSLCQQNAKMISTWNVNQKPGLFHCHQTNGSYSRSSLSKARRGSCNSICFYIR